MITVKAEGKKPDFKNIICSLLTALRGCFSIMLEVSMITVKAEGKKPDFKNIICSLLTALRGCFSIMLEVYAKFSFLSLNLSVSNITEGHEM